ncbi:MAG: AmmeMemoRadiSam system protein A [Bacteroidetes bacterium]|nr:AmmeMemoRadiSam system protein A [Bacteroidota bacterium]
MEVDIFLSQDEKRELLSIARQAATRAVSRQGYVPVEPSSRELKRKAAGFVTLRENGELRGCIGYVEARLPLYQTIAETAAKAAVGDPRFEPVSETELKNIEVEISVLSPLHEIKSTDEIIIGKHGVLVEKDFYRGLLLPQVATENNWDKEQFLSYTCTKAGLDRDCYKNPRVRIYVFTADVFSEEEFGAAREESIVERT